jgi:signal transduction histidine kinase
MPEAMWKGEAARFGRTGLVTSTSAGIGFAIVAAGAAAHGGTLRFERAPSGAFEAAIVFPAPAEEPS